MENDQAKAVCIAQPLCAERVGSDEVSEDAVVVRGADVASDVDSGLVEAAGDDDVAGRSPDVLPAAGKARMTRFRPDRRKVREESPAARRGERWMAVHARP